MFNEIVKKTLVNGGSTTSLKGKQVNNGYMVSLEKKELKMKHFDSKILRVFISKNIKLLLSGVAFLGTWKDEQTNVIYLDCSVNIKSLDRAMKVARENKQLAIYDLNNNISIYLNN